MLKKTTTTKPAAARTTMPLKGTVARVSVQLDFPSKLAIAWARRWIKSGPGATHTDPLESGVVRRALEVYAGHLGHPDTDPTAEARAVRWCCERLSADQDAQEAAQERLQAHDEGAPLPPWPEALRGPTGGLDVDAINAKADALFNDIASTKWGRLRGLKPITNQEPTE